MNLASGKVHAQAADSVILAGSIASFALLPWQLAVLATSGLVIGKYANPDVRDQEDVRNHAEHLIGRQLGCLFGWLWTAYWFPLAWLIPHRHWASHLPGVATIIAWVYMFGPWLALIAALDPNRLWIVVVIACWTLPGWFVQDVVHLALDGWRIRW